MKRLTPIIVLIYLLSCKQAFAKVCVSNEIEKFQKEIDNVSYNLEYDSTYKDMNGTAQIGFFKLMPVNLPQNYTMLVEDSTGIYFLSTQDTCSIEGGIYKVSIKNQMCDNAITTFEIRVPFYKQYCELEKECEHVWDDGTKEVILEKNDPSKNDKSVFDTKIIIAITSIIVIFATTFVIIKIRRRKRI